MKDFHRTNLLFSLCGLNCGLCPMRLDHYCPGCGGGPGNQSCAIAKCSLSHGKPEYCFQCGAFPCEAYRGVEEWDSFITHKNQLEDLKKAQRMGIEAYNAELEAKMGILASLLSGFQDGRRKTLFSVAVNLLELGDLQGVMERLPGPEAWEGVPLKERASQAVRLLQEVADKKQVELKLRKKLPKKKEEPAERGPTGSAQGTAGL